MRKENNFRRPPQKQRRHKINEEVRFPEVRVIRLNEDPIIMSSHEAFKLAEDEELDLILISETANPPVVRIDDYNKFLYHLEKIEKEKKKSMVKVETKEIQLSVDIAENDLRTKARKSAEFLGDGDKVKCVLQLKGRQKSMPHRGEAVVSKMLEILSDVGEPESPPKFENSKWIVLVRPKRKK